MGQISVKNIANKPKLKYSDLELNVLISCTKHRLVQKQIK